MLSYKNHSSIHIKINVSNILRKTRKINEERRKEDGKEGGIKKNEKQELRRNVITTLISLGISL